MRHEAETIKHRLVQRPKKQHGFNRLATNIHLSEAARTAVLLASRGRIDEAIVH